VSILVGIEVVLDIKGELSPVIVAKRVFRLLYRFPLSPWAKKGIGMYTVEDRQRFFVKV
jgi:hypothetical protein